MKSRFTLGSAALSVAWNAEYNICNVTFRRVKPYQGGIADQMSRPSLGRRVWVDIRV